MDRKTERASSHLRASGRSKGVDTKLLALHEYVARLSSTTSVEDVYNHTLDAMNLALGFSHADFSMVEGSWLRTKAQRGIESAYSDMRLDGPGVIVKAASQKKAIYVPDTRKEAAYVHARRDMLSELAVPVILDNQTVGVLNVESTKLDGFDREDRQLLGTLASQVSSCLDRLRGEQSLRRSETTMRGILDAIPGLVFQLDSRGVFTDYYAPSPGDLAYPPESFLGKSIHAVLPTPLADTIENALSIAREAGKVQVVEYRLPTRNGTMADWEAHISPTSMGGVVCVINNVTERKKAEDRLRQLEERYHSLFDGMLDGAYLSTHEGRFVDVNPAFVSMFRYSSKQEMLDIPSVKDALYFSPEDRASHFLDTGQEKVEVYRMRRKDGSEIWVEDHGRYIHDRDGRVILHEGVLRDVTERVQAEEALRESEKRYRDLVEMSPDAVAVHDGKKLLFANPSAAKVLGEEDPGKLVGLEMVRFVHPDSRPTVLGRANGELNHRGKEPMTEEKFLRTDGRTIDVEVTGMPVTWHGTRATLVAFRDVTERRLMAEKLKRYSAHLEELVEERTEKLREAERLAAMGQLASMVAHDLRNPLTGITGAVYHLRKKLGRTADEKTKEMLEIIERDVEYSNEMMTGLIEYSAEVRLQLIEADAKAIVDRALQLVRVPNNVRISNFARDKPKVELDVEKMTRVSVNLIQNALEAMPEGGELKVASQKSGRNLRLLFSDTGEGIKKEVLSRIWVPFSTTKAKGMGLGLPMAKHIIEEHGGSISIKSVVGKGTTVTVTLPIKTRAKSGEVV